MVIQGCLIRYRREFVPALPCETVWMTLARSSRVNLAGCIKNEGKAKAKNAMPFRKMGTNDKKKGGGGDILLLLRT